MTEQINNINASLLLVDEEKTEKIDTRLYYYDLNDEVTEKIDLKRLDLTQGHL